MIYVAQTYLYSKNHLYALLTQTLHYFKFIQKHIEIDCLINITKG